MIKASRRQLALVYSVIIGLILIAMAVLFYLILSAVIQRDLQDRLESSGTKAADEWLHKPLDTDETNVTPGGRHKMEWEYMQADQFAVIYSKDLKVLAQYPAVRNPLLMDEIRTQLASNGKDSRFNLERCGSQQESCIVVHSPLNDGKGSSLYIGEYNGKQVLLLTEMRWLLAALSLLLLAMASIVGYIFAGRAMIPIMRSIERQKQFTADASHELRTPLSVLRSSVEILEEQEHRLPEVHRTVLSHMKEEVERMTRLTGQLLMLARRDSGMEQLAAVRFDLQACVRSAVDRMELAARKKQIQIRFAGGDRSDPLHYTGDADQISQLLYILLDNAVKYSYPGGTVTVQACRREDGIEIEVRDEGCGIPKKDIPHLFERFYRVDKARARELGGSGLGLTIADAIVRNHGGSIAVSSEMNRGSRFVIHLPRLDQR